MDDRQIVPRACRLETMLYLDFNATTPLAPEVTEVMTSALTTTWGNPSSQYEHGKQANALLQEARADVADMLGSKASDIIFTSGGTEANNQVIFGVLQYFGEHQQEISSSAPQKPHIITTAVEHDSVLKPIEFLQKLGKLDATMVGVDSRGALSADEVLSAVRPSTCLVSVMLANNETGVIMPVEQIGRKLQALNKSRKSQNLIKILLHSDAAQAIGKISVDVDNLLVDYLTIVGHKFYGPRGGCLYIRGPQTETPVYPLLFGGGQERSLRPGTENVVTAAGLGCAARLVTKNLEQYAENMLCTRQHLETQLKEEFKEDVVINFRHCGVDVLPNTCSVSFVGSSATGAELLRGCKRIEASVGAACHGNSKPSGVLMASGIGEEEARRTLRLSVGRGTTTQDIDAAVAELRQSFNDCNECKNGK